MLAYAERALEIRDALDGRGNTQAPEPYPTNAVSLLSTEEALDFLNGQRPELLAVDAAFSDITLNHAGRFRQRFPPYGLVWRSNEPLSTCRVEVVDGVNNIYGLRVPMSHTIKAARGEIFDFLSGTQPFDDWHGHFEQLLGYFRASPVKIVGNYDSPEAFMNGGFDTAIDMSVRTLDLVNQAHGLYAPNASDEEIAETAQRARRIPFNLARTIRLDHARQVFNALGNVAWNNTITPATAFDISRFNITPDKYRPNILDIRYGSGALRDPDNPDRKLANVKSQLDHHGCPGLVDFSHLEDPYSHTADRIYQNLIDLIGQLCLWRSDAAAPKQAAPPM